MKRGEIHWYKLARPDKKRPVLILARDSILDYLGEVTIASITSTVRGIPSEVALSSNDGMRRECAVNCDQLQTVAKGRLGPLITTLSAARLSAVSRAIRFALAIE